jgi:hypothetical protein
MALSCFARTWKPDLLQPPDSGLAAAAAPTA